MAAALTFHGERFRVAGKIGLMPLMRFAKLAQAGVDTDEMDGLVAIYDLLEQCIDTSRYCAGCGEAERDGCCDGRRIVDDWTRFTVLATAHRDQGEELLDIVKQAVELMADRPTLRSSGSSDGPPSTSGSSTEGSSSPVVRRLERRGRPDLGLIVAEAIGAQQARAS